MIPEHELYGQILEDESFQIALKKDNPEAIKETDERENEDLSELKL
jgi:hypothetical protein